MRLTEAEFKRLKELQSKKDLTDAEKSELEALLAKKKQASKKRGKGNNHHAGGNSAPWGNHFPWWNKYPAILKDASNIAFNWIPGTGLTGAVGESASLIEAVGAMAIKTANVYGAEDSITGSLNMQCRNIWLAMHRKYRGIQSYQASDVGAVLIAGVEFVATLAEIERVYGVVNYYSMENRNLPYAVLRAMGVSTTLANDLRLHLADFRYGINQLIMRAQNVLLPKDMSIIASRISTYGYLYADHKSKRSQVYAFRSIASGTFSATLPGGSAVVFDRSKVIKSCNTYTDILGILQTQVTALVEDDDVNKIYSDLLAYLGNENFLTVQLLPEAYVVVPQFDESVLHKIHNIKSLGFSAYNDGTGAYIVNDIVPVLFTHQTTISAELGKWAITQKDNVLCTKVSLADEGGNGAYAVSGDDLRFQFGANYFVPPYTGYGRKSLLDTYDNPMDEEHITEGVLYKPCFEYSVNGGEPTYVSNSAAFELVCGFEAFINRKGTVTEFVVEQYSFLSGYMNANVEATTLKLALQSLTALSQFDWAPIFYRLIDDDVKDIYLDDQAIDKIGVSTNVPGPSFGCDVDNCRFVDYEEIYRVHETVVLSGFYTSVGATSADESK